MFYFPMLFSNPSAFSSHLKILCKELIVWMLLNRIEDDIIPNVMRFSIYAVIVGTVTNSTKVRCPFSALNNSSYLVSRGHKK